MATSEENDDVMHARTGDDEDVVTTLLEKVAGKGQLKNQSLLAKLTDFLLDESPDPVPVTEESHPVFYHATKNDTMYHFVPKKGVGIQKDGTKLHCFDYEASFHNRSRDFYDVDIQAAIKANNIHRLSNLLVAAYTDLVLDGNSDMTSYMYLMDMAIHSLSEPVKEAIGPDLSKDGGIALALVTELVATSSTADALFKRAVLSREEMEGLNGLEGANESYVRKVYAAITPAVETKGVLLNNGIDISQGWGKDLVDAAPSVDKLVNMNFKEFNGIVKPPAGDRSNNLADLKAPTGERLIAHQMYAGLIGSPSGNIVVPSIRGYVLENNLSPQVAHELEVLGHEDLTDTNDKDMYAAARAVLDNLKPSTNTSQGTGDASGHNSPPSFEGTNKPHAPNGGSTSEEGSKLSTSTGSASEGSKVYDSTPGSVPGTQVDGDAMEFTKMTVPERQKAWEDNEAQKKKEADRDNYVKGKMNDVRQDSIQDKATGSGPKHRFEQAGGVDMKASPTIGKLAGKSALEGGVASVAGSAAGAAGEGGKAEGIAASMAGPLSVALALAPIIKDLAGETDRKMNEDMDSAIAEREKIAAEVSDLLDSVKSATSSTGDALTDAQNKAQSLLDKVRNPGALALSEAQGMNLQKQLHALETNFGPTGMASLVPYTSDAELVAAVDSGRALSAVALFVDHDMVISTPQRQMLQTPKYVSMMGASQPFETKTKRSTSEKEIKSFVNSASHSGFSTADKTVTTKSRSRARGGNAIFAGAKRKTSNSEQTERGEMFVQTDDSERNEENGKKGTQAFLTEFTVMPMKTFCLREGGLALSPYAFYRLQRIVNDKDANGELIIEDVRREIYRRFKARQFLINFGSHIPFGVQTLGGVFIRIMKITTETETSLSTLYSTAAKTLTKTNSEASKDVTTKTRRVGFLGMGGSNTSSTGHSMARSSGSTEMESMTEGNGDSSSATKSYYESDVMCFGPNAATQDSLYQQLMSNNATWTIIDRGEPDSYMAVWDLVDYIGQGGMLKEECKLLREVWEEMALSNSAHFADASDSRNALLDVVMTDYEVKQEMFNFVQALIFCLVPKNGHLYDAELAKNFEMAVNAGIKATSQGGIFDLSSFMNAEVTKAAEQATHTDSDEHRVKRPRLSPPAAFELKFDLVPGNEGYNLATRILNEISNDDWSIHFSYFSDTFTASIIDKGKPSYLYDVCQVCCTAVDQGNWALVKKLMSPDLTETTRSMEALFRMNLINYLSHKDEASGNHCLHLIIGSNDLELVKNAHEACTSIALIKNKAGKTPKQLVDSDSEKYSNLTGYEFPPKLSNVGDAAVWAVDNKQNVYFLDCKDKNAKWKEVGDQKIKHIATSDNGKEIWGVGTHGSVYQMLPKVSLEWKRIVNRDLIYSAIDSIAVSADGDHVWAIDEDGLVYKFLKDKDKWRIGAQHYGETRMKSIAVVKDGSKVYGIKREDGSCWVTYFGGDMNDEDWEAYGERTTGFEQISVSPSGNFVWVTDWKGQVRQNLMGGWRFVDPDVTRKKARHLSVDNGGNMWSTGCGKDSGQVWYRRSNDQSWIDKMLRIPKILFQQISACDTTITETNPFRGNHIWLVGTDGKIYHFSQESSYRRAEVIPLPHASSSVRSISSNSQGEVWIVDNLEKLFYRNGNRSTWQFLRHNVGLVAVGGKGGIAWTSSSISPGQLPTDLVCDIDFAAAGVDGTSSTPFELLGGANILNGAPGCGRALRIAGRGQLAKVPGVEFNRSKMPSCTLVIGVYLESIPNNAKGWVMNNEDALSTWARGIYLHDSRVKGTGMALNEQPVWESDKYPEVKEWHHIVAVYNNNAPSHFYLNGVKATHSPTDNSGDGFPDLYIGGLRTNHDFYCDCWVKEVKVFNRGLDDTEVKNLTADFQSNMHMNVARGKATAQSSTANNQVSELAVNGDLRAMHTFTHTIRKRLSPFWHVLLGRSPVLINSVVIYSRDKLFPGTKVNVSTRLKGFRMEILNVVGETEEVIHTYNDTSTGDPGLIIRLEMPGAGIIGNKVKISLPGKTEVLHLCEVQVFSNLGSGRVSLNYERDGKEIIKNRHCGVRSIQSLAISDNEEFLSYSKFGGTHVSYKLSDSSHQFTLSESAHNGALFLNDEGKAIGTHNGRISTKSFLDDRFNVENGSHDWGTHSHSLSMTKSGQHIWAIKKDGKLYYKANMEANVWEEVLLTPKDVALSMVSVS